MGKYLKLFENHSQYDTFIGGGGETPFVRPNVSHCIEENHVHYNPWTYADAYLTFVAKEDGTFKLSTKAVNYSLDNGETWTNLPANTVSPTITAGNKIMWKAQLTPTTANGIGTFSSTGQFNVKGNIMSLLFGDNFKRKTSLSGKNYAFKKLFYNNTNLKDASKMFLPATTLATACYSSMFDGCTNLVKIPTLPATTLSNGCYNYMFNGCTSLTIAPMLPATTLANSCYNYMFQGCTSLVTVPELPVTTLADACYRGMFNGCTSLTTAPELPATTLAIYCYQYMFQGCTSLVTIPEELPATTLEIYCYASMFKDCSSLTMAPELPATTLANYCYTAMFDGCTSLTTAPVLPATTLASSCYQNMFNGCTSLTTAPVLPATTLASSCYDGMFQGCTGLNYIKAMFTATPSISYTKDWVSGVASSGTFVKNSAATWNVTGVNGIPTGWTVETATT